MLGKARRASSLASLAFEVGAVLLDVLNHGVNAARYICMADLLVKWNTTPACARDAATLAIEGEDQAR